VPRILALFIFCCTALVQAETVQLRKNGNIVTFEYITQDEDTITVQIPGRDSVLTYKWDDLDQDWIKKNNPKIWAERELLTKGEDKKMDKPKTEEVDPFAKEVAPEDTKTILRNFSISVQDGLKGMPIVNIEATCKEFELDEASFWKAYEELKKTSKGPIALGKEKEAALLVDKTPEKPEKTDTPAVAKTPKPTNTAKNKNTKDKTTPTAQRSQDNVTHEADAKKDFDADVRPFTLLGYLRNFSDGSIKSKPTWIMFRRSAEDRRTIVALLRKYETMSGELAEKTADRNTKTDALVLKKAFGSTADTLEKVTREVNTIDVRLQQDCGALLAKIQPLLK
jgi:hypothetical protein